MHQPPCLQGNPRNEASGLGKCGCSFFWWFCRGTTNPGRLLHGYIPPLLAPQSSGPSAGQESTLPVHKRHPTDKVASLSFLPQPSPSVTHDIATFSHITFSSETMQLVHKHAFILYFLILWPQEQHVETYGFFCNTGWLLRCFAMSASKSVKVLVSWLWQVSFPRLGLEISQTPYGLAHFLWKHRFVAAQAIL